MNEKKNAKKYFFHLGKNRALSVAEIRSVLPGCLVELMNHDLLLVESCQAIDAKALIARLGGTIKIGEILGEAALYSPELFDMIKAAIQPGEGKFKYGISNHNKFASPQKDKLLALRIKNYLKEKEVSCRWVTGRERVLSSVIVEQNLMKENGLEIVLLGDYKHCLVGRTLAVQPFKDLSLRDYGRPSRDDHSGMLPPKLGQIMLNLAEADKDSVILDPFCGSGTILAEAMLMGYDKLIGSDLSAKAISDTRDNLAWLKRKFALADAEVELMVADATALRTSIKASSLGAIVTEPYLGPQRGDPDPQKVQRELGQLYSRAIAVFAKLLRPGGRLVMVWPVRVTKEKNFFLSPDTAGLRPLHLFDEREKKEYRADLSPRGHILYGREGQRVWREIVVFSK